MKTIAIPLLLATAAKAEASKRQAAERMAGDFAQAQPVLIATEVHETKCADSASGVAALSQDVADLKTALAALEEPTADLATANTAVATMTGLRTEAVDALLAAETDGRTLIDADDTAQAAFVTAQAAWHQATYLERLALEAKTAAQGVKDASDAETAAIGELLTALTLASAEATAHHAAEVAALGKSDLNGGAANGSDWTLLEKAKFDANAALTAKKTAINEDQDVAVTALGAGLKKTLATAQATLDGHTAQKVIDEALVAEKLAAKTQVDALKVNIEKDYSADYTFLSSDVGVTEGFFTAVDTKKKAYDALVTAAAVGAAWGDNILVAENAWKAKALLTVAARTAYMTTRNGTAATDYEAAGAVNAICDASAITLVQYKKTDGSSVVNNDAALTIDECAAICNFLHAWNKTSLAPSAGPPDANGLDATPYTEQTTADISDSNKDGMCFGIQWATNACNLVSKAIPTVVANAESSVGTSCLKRKQSVQAGEWITADGLSKTSSGGLLFEDIATKIAAGGADRVTQDTADREVLLAKAAFDHFNAATDHADAGGSNYSGAVAVAALEHTAATDALGVTTAAIAELEHASNGGNDWYAANAAYNAAVAELPALQLASDNADAAEASANTEIAAQLVIKETAIAELAAQQALVDARAGLASVTTAASDALAADSAYGLAQGVTSDALAARASAGVAALGDDWATTATGGSKAAATAKRAAVVAAGQALAGARSNLAGAVSEQAAAIGAVNAKKGEIAAKEAEELTAITACEALAYDAYAAALVVAKDERAAKIAKIEKLIDTAEEAAPAAKAAGSRCELAPSNGTMRPGRFQGAENYVCAAELCCGAAVVPMPGQATTTMTVETCQPVATETYEWTPPRAPLATEWPAVVSAPFACIDGAKKLAAAVSALAATVYMLA